MFDSDPLCIGNQKNHPPAEQPELAAHPNRFFVSQKRLHIFFDKKLRIWTSTESFLRLSDFQDMEFLTRFLGFMTILIKQCFDAFPIFRQ